MNKSYIAVKFPERAASMSPPELKYRNLFRELPLTASAAIKQIYGRRGTLDGSRLQARSRLGTEHAVKTRRHEWTELLENNNSLDANLHVISSRRTHRVYVTLHLFPPPRPLTP